MHRKLVFCLNCWTGLLRNTATVSMWLGCQLLLVCPALRIDSINTSGLQANIFKALVLLGSSSFGGGISEEPDFPLSQARGVEEGNGIHVPEIAIPRVRNEWLFPSALLLTHGNIYTDWWHNRDEIHISDPFS